MTVWLGARWGAQRSLGVGPFLVWVFSLLMVGMVAVVERRLNPVVATDNALLGAVGGLAVPLLAYGCVARITGPAQREAMEGAARYGADRRIWLIGCVVMVGTIFAVAAAVLAALTVVAAGASGVLPLAIELYRSSAITALAGAAYVALFLCGASVGRRGWLRPVLLVLDWIVGGATTAVALPFPRGQLRALLGGEPVLGLDQGWAWVVLWGLAIAYTALAVARVPR